MSKKVVDGLLEESLDSFDSLLDFFQRLVTVEKRLEVADGDVKALDLASHVEALDRNEECGVYVEVNDGSVDLLVERVLDVRGNLAYKVDFSVCHIKGWGLTRRFVVDIECFVVFAEHVLPIWEDLLDVNCLYFFSG